MNRNRDSGPNAGVGMASVMMIVLVLALTTFGVLSLVSAQADARLSHRARENAEAFYEAEGRLQEQLADLDAALLAGREELPKEGSIRLIEEVREGQELMIELARPEEESGRFAVWRCGLVNISEWTPDENIKIWNGGIGKVCRYERF